MKLTVKVRDGQGRWFDQAAYSDPNLELVVAKALNEPGYVIVHRRTGGALLKREALKDCLKVLLPLLHLTDWSKAFEALPEGDHRPTDPYLLQDIQTTVGGKLWPN
jgi:hypothetical protein